MSNTKHLLGLAAIATLCLPLAALAEAYTPDNGVNEISTGLHVVRPQSGRQAASAKYITNYQVPMVAPSYPRGVKMPSSAMEVGGLSATVSGARADYLPEVCREGTFVWPAQCFPLKVFIEDGSGTPGYRPNFAQFAADAFNTWDKATNHKLSWQQVSSPHGADITVRWTDAVTERVEGTEAGKTAALTRLDPSTGLGTIAGAKMQFLTRLPQRTFSDDEVKKTCLHEVGHALGLQGHSSNRGDIMYYAVSPTQGALTGRDITTMNKLYDTYPAGAAQVTLGPKVKF